jgi:hypothetical protein
MFRGYVRSHIGSWNHRTWDTHTRHTLRGGIWTGHLPPNLETNGTMTGKHPEGNLVESAWSHDEFGSVFTCWLLFLMGVGLHNLRPSMSKEKQTKTTWMCTAVGMWCPWLKPIENMEPSWDNIWTSNQFHHCIPWQSCPAIGWTSRITHMEVSINGGNPQ